MSKSKYDRINTGADLDTKSRNLGDNRGNNMMLTNQTNENDDGIRSEGKEPDHNIDDSNLGNANFHIVFL